MGGTSGTSLEDWGVLFKPFLEWFEGSVTIEVNSFLVVFWIEDQSWISSNFNSFGLIGSGIELSNDNVVVVLVGSTEFFPDWSELLAMSAPWSIVFNENILGWVLNDLFEFSSDNNGNWSLFGWDWFGFEMWLDGS